MIVAAVKLNVDGSNMNKNLYSVLQLDRHCTHFEVRQAYKKMARLYHPDKNPADRSILFPLIMHSYDILINEEKRELYNLYGEDGLNFNQNDELFLHFIQMLSIYIFWGICIYLLTLPQSSRSSRPWIAVIMAIMSAAHSVLSFFQIPLPGFLTMTPMATLTEHEAVCYMHSIFPLVCVTLILLAEGMFIDTNAMSLKFFENTIARNEEIKKILDHIGQVADVDVIDKESKEKSRDELRKELVKVTEVMTQLDKEASYMLRVFKTTGSSSRINFLPLLLMIVFAFL